MDEIERARAREPLRLALGGSLAIASALGIGRFVYTPILPAMIATLGWSKADAGLVASANFLGYLIGAFAAGHRVFAADPRRWLVIGLLLSAATTAASGLSSALEVIAAMRFIGGVASAFVLICATTLVLDQVARSGDNRLPAIQFAGAGAGIVVSAAAVSLLLAAGAGWQMLWLAAGVMAALLAAGSAALVPRQTVAQSAQGPASSRPADPGAVALISAYTLFGFGYVVMVTFLVTIVRQTPQLQPIEPWIWILFGLAAIPSVPVWQQLAARIGLLRAYAVACLVEAIGVVACVVGEGIAAACITAVLLGGTFLGITALGLMGARALSAGRPQRMIGFMTAGFSVGQMVGPLVAGILVDRTGGFLVPSLIAAGALVVAAVLAAVAHVQAGRSAP